jgi:phosphoribosylanthranilate isomerase
MMQAVKIKICGITNLEDALAAAEAGADYLGYNFYTPSPRSISPAVCERVQAGLESRGVSVRTVGVFVNEPVDKILHILDTCGLDLAQLSGDEPPSAVQELAGLGFKVVRPQNRKDAENLAHKYSAPETLPSLLIDAYRPGLYGGTGVTGDWRLASSLTGRRPVMLAGGLHPGNAAQAILHVRPWGLDVASGVEASPGCKDAKKMREFILAVKNLPLEGIIC